MLQNNPLNKIKEGKNFGYGDKNLMVCICGHSGDEHEWSEPQVCKNIDCHCTQFIPASPQSPVILDYMKYMERMETIIDKMQWMLANLRFFRNLSNKHIVFAWWQYVDGWDRRKPLTDELYTKLTEAESITRSRRYWVEQNPELYGRFIATAEEERVLKQIALTEYFTMKQI